MGTWTQVVCTLVIFTRPPPRTAASACRLRVERTSGGRNREADAKLRPAVLSPRLSASLRGIAGLIALVGAGCAINPVSGWPEFTLVSVEQERRLGEEEAKKVEAQMGVLEDATLTGYLEALGQRLARESPREDVTHRFRILDMAEPNAFALPGGPVYVSR